MKWLLLLAVIGLSVQLFRQNSQINELNVQLEAARVTITELENKPAPAPLRYDAFGSNRPGTPASGNRSGTMLDATPKPHR